MSRRRATRRVKPAVVVGWTEVWTSVDTGFEREGAVIDTRPASTLSLAVRLARARKRLAQRARAQP